MKTKKDLIDLVNKRIKFLKAEERTKNYTDGQKYGFVCDRSLPVDLDKAEADGKIDILYARVPKSIAFSKFLRTLESDVVEEVVEPTVEPVVEPTVEPVVEPDVDNTKSNKKSEATIEEVLDDEEEIDE